MNAVIEWQQLKAQLRRENYTQNGFDNQFFRRLLVVLSDPGASILDKLLAYRDALLASDDPMAERLSTGIDRKATQELLELVGLSMDAHGRIFLDQEQPINAELAPIYALEPRRFIHSVPTDPALRSRLRNDHFANYNGVAQRLAVRLAITSRQRSTLIINLPTGCGKTLVAHAISVFSPEGHLTVVVVPTIGLAIEQGNRAAALFKSASSDHGGSYCWHGQQTAIEHEEVKTRIREGRQRLLFCSPEAACRSLLPTLFAVAKTNRLGAMVIDEAHVVDQWGADFRPYFQILASLVRSLRRTSTVGIKCLLMSATFTEKSLGLVRELFSDEEETPIHVNGAFLRPEIQYGVDHVSANQHMSRVIDVAVQLPKPMIIYALTPRQADATYAALKKVGMRRIGLFTGETDAATRERLIHQWGAGELDFMVGTSAFGLGMDKPDVRSIVHAAVPESLDRFYQEVGRGGRDGRACQSMLIYSSEQITDARRFGADRLITVELGMAKWKAMWQHGAPISDGRRKVAVNAIRLDQSRVTEGNEEWNWRTLLLMQRTGLIRIDLEEPVPPAFEPSSTSDEYHRQLKDYYDQYYKGVIVVPLRDDHLNANVWQTATQQRRDYEKKQQREGLQILLDWLRNPTALALCDSLTTYYTLDGVQPEFACGGCPHCLSHRAFIEFPTVGKTVYTDAPPAAQWRRPLKEKQIHCHVYFPATGVTQRRLLRNWRTWLLRLIESGAIEAISASASVLQTLESEFGGATSAFWIGDVLGDASDETKYWPQLVIQIEQTGPIRGLGWPESTKILIAPEEAVDPKNTYRRWWESVPDSMSLDNFLLGFNYGAD